MARIKRIWGPSKRADSPGMAVWTFSAEHEDGRTAMYRLTFFLDSRRFKVNHLGEDKQAKAYLQTMHTLMKPDDGIFEGKVTDILKARIPPEQLAAVTARALLHGRK
ncbi:hypothetical protein J2X65_003524 [Ancylobacter sp. 3268]|uniref:hypothetical protein n=1 Tax=Ancylobacter sp. 3268 TaxID=2817752 RepID=UPI00286768BF|nr:hypothetical protein [Ancylobacter sp. 3268]MDR6954156.1 hypothetical protein [Ancylobacter sp. 3268]